MIVRHAGVSVPRADIPAHHFRSPPAINQLHAFRLSAFDVMSAAVVVSRRFLTVVALGWVLLVAGCSAGPVATWRAAPVVGIVPSPTTSATTPPLPGFTTRVPLPVINYG